MVLGAEPQKEQESQCRGTTTKEILKDLNVKHTQQMNKISRQCGNQLEGLCMQVLLCFKFWHKWHSMATRYPRLSVFRDTHTHTPPMQYVQERAWSAPKPGGLVGRVSRCRAVQGTAPKSDGSDHDGSKVHGDSPPPAGVLFEASRSGGRLQGLRRPTISPPKHGCLPQQGLWYTLEGLFVQLLS